MAYAPVESPLDPAVERELRRVGDAMRILTLVVHNRAVVRPAEGQVVICDGVNWNPLGDGIKRPIWFDVDTGTWKSFS